MLRFAEQLPENNRIEILGAVELIVSRYLAGELYASIVMPPRFGKSDIIRLSALEINAISKYPAILTAPWEDNVVQIGDVNKIISMYRRYGIPKGTHFAFHRCQYLKTNKWWELEAARPTLIAATLGLINNSANQQQFLDGIEDIYQRSGARVPVFVDECHIVKDKKAFGKLIARVVEVGGFVVLLTGTPVPGIPGFEELYDEWEDIIRKLPRSEWVNGERKYFLETYEGERRKVTGISANITVEWKRAFELGALASVNAVWIDVDVIDKETGEPLGPLSGLASGDLSSRLRDIQASPELMSKMALAGVQRLLAMRREGKTARARALVVTGNDSLLKNDISNKHATAYRHEIIEALRACGEDPRSWTIAICTGVDADGVPNKDAAKTIKAFRDGLIDILIVKGMGIVGLDVPECKVLIFGSTLRDGPMAIQALSRALTAWEGTLACLVLPRDAKMVQLYNRVIADNGGEYYETDVSLIDKVEVAAPDEKPEWGYKDARVDAYGDEKGNILSGNYELVLAAIRRKYPDVGLSEFQIIQCWQAGAFPVDDDDIATAQQTRKTKEESGIQDLDEGLAKHEGEFGSTAKSIISRHINYADRPKWLQALKDIQALAKRICGVSNRKVSHIDDAVLLERLIAALGDAERQMFPNV